MLTEGRRRMGATQIEAGGITDPLGVDGWTEGG